MNTNEQTDALLSELEGMRKACFPKLMLSLVLIIFGFITFLFMPPVSIVLIIIGFLLMFFWYSPAKKLYRGRYKETLVNGLFTQYFDNISYQPESGFSEGFIQSTGFMMMGNIFHSEDMITGEYKGVHFERADVTIQEETETTDANGNTTTSTTTYFQGRWVIFSHNKHFDYDLQLVQKGFSHSRNKTGFFTRKTDRRHEVEFENEEFNRNFKCYCQDDQEAFYLITPQLMEAVMSYAGTKKDRLMLGFRNDYIHAATQNGKDSLEPSTFRQVSYEHDILPIMEEIDAIRSFVDTLNLDRDIFKA